MGSVELSVTLVGNTGQQLLYNAVMLSYSVANPNLYHTSYVL